MPLQWMFEGIAGFFVECAVEIGAEMVGDKLSGNRTNSSPAPADQKRRPRPSLKRNLQGYGPTEVDEPAQIIEMSEGLSVWNDDEAFESGVKLKVMIGRDGKIKYVQIFKTSCGKRTKNAVEAAKKIHCRPARKDHRPVPQWLILKYKCS